MVLLLQMKRKKKQKSQQGFTIIELLVVISIIGLLSSIVMYATVSARVKGRDAKRVQDLQVIAQALDMYYQDNGTYPVPSGAEYWFSAANYPSGDTYEAYNWANFQIALAPYIAKLPVDPINNNSASWVPGGYNYSYGWVAINPANGRQGYSLVAAFEDPNNPLRCEISSSSYPWHWWYSGTKLCHNGGPGGWDYNLLGYNASTSPPW